MIRRPVSRKGIHFNGTYRDMNLFLAARSLIGEILKKH
uniref:Uncharacterized protein n=1 Tax=Arundo donax TaxID=35708 RepID=A0A0A8YMW0_ARUDO